MPDNPKPRKTGSKTTISRPEMLPGGTDAEFRHLVHDLLAFSSRLQEIRASFGAYIGLTGIQYTILISIRHLDEGEGVGVKTVADHLSLSSSFVTIETKKLIARELLQKRTDEIDRRRVRMTISPAGDTLLEQLRPVQQQVNDALFASLESADFEWLRRMAGTMKEDADKALRLAHFLSGAEPDA